MTFSLKNFSSLMASSLVDGGVPADFESLGPYTGEFSFPHSKSESLDGLRSIWHPTKIDHHELTKVSDVIDGEFVKRHLSLVTHPLFEKPVFMKTGSTPELVERIETEAKAYQLIQGKGIGPEFLGHVTESGCVIGFLTEWVEGATEMNPDNAEGCFEVLMELHVLGISHGDTHGGNFLYKDGKALMIDFEYASFDPTKGDFENDIEIFNRWLKRMIASHVGR